jgi:hypothetical protein
VSVCLCVCSKRDILVLKETYHRPDKEQKRHCDNEQKRPTKRHMMIDRPDRKIFFLKKTRPNTALVFYEQEEAGLGVLGGRYHFEEREKKVSEKKKKTSQ